jgi:hypothetical protein
MKRSHAERKGLHVNGFEPERVSFDERPAEPAVPRLQARVTLQLTPEQAAHLRRIVAGRTASSLLVALDQEQQRAVKESVDLLAALDAASLVAGAPLEDEGS